MHHYHHLLLRNSNTCKNQGHFITSQVLSHWNTHRDRLHILTAVQGGKKQLWEGNTI